MATTDRAEHGESRSHATATIDLDRYLPFLIIATANRLSSSASRAYLTQFGVGVTAWRVLANLKAQPGMTANAICARSGLDKGPVSRAVAELIESGHIRCEEAAGDGRKRPLHLTTGGITLQDRIAAVALARERRLLADLTGPQVEGLLGALSIVHRNALRLE